MLNKRYQLGNATEHTYRGDLQHLLEALVPDVAVTNEPKRQACGAPDYILTRKDIPIGFIEAKDIGDKDLFGAKKLGNKEQFDRYKAALSNLIFTDYVDFHFYRDGELIAEIAVANLQNGKIVALPDNFAQFTDLMRAFCFKTGEIKNSKKLAEMMAGKARLLSDVIEKALNHDETDNEDSSLKKQLTAFKKILIHDITPHGFADVYAQTIAYGLFAARLHDTDLATFTRAEAAELIPKSNPFLRKLFGYIAGPDLDDRMKWIVDDLVEIFLACDIKALLKNYGKSTQTEAPIIHFYETFLSEYDPKLRKARGVWYTPAPVVDFMVRAVDDLLKSEFDLPQGLADRSKMLRKIKVQDKLVEKELHTVQILDPATGTGTFLAQVIKQVQLSFKGQEGIWSSYVETDLLPRLHGFELLMASYAMAHLQLDLLLSELGYTPSAAKKNQRLNVYLTNSLEESHPDADTLFAEWLSTEANEANHIKRDAPVMCVIGNPPYSGISSNNGAWIAKLIDDYKYVDGVHFNEKKHWLNDDYVKFLRYGQHFIEKNGSGILAFINPHGFLDNPTFRGMRWHLLKTYDKIYTIDLHGNAKKKETAPDGGADQNVFDIMQGVSINLFVKTGKKAANELGQVFHYDLYGKRAVKYDFLLNNSLKKIDFNRLKPNSPNFFFVPKNDEGRKKYESGFSVNELFTKNVTGIVTMGDEFAFAENKSTLKNRLIEFKNTKITENELKNKYHLGKNYAEFILKNKDLIVVDDKFIECAYRPFDKRVTYFDNKILWRWRHEVMQHFLKGDNVGLTLCKQFKTGNEYFHVFIAKNIIESSYVSNRTSEITSTFPLYLYPTDKTQDLLEEGETRKPNLDEKILKKMAKSLKLKSTPESPEKADAANLFAPLDVLDYIYAVLHSPTYRANYKAFLKIDFPRVPYPKDAATFWDLVKLGGQLRAIHLLESAEVKQYITQYPQSGDNLVTKIDYKDGKVSINDTQYFDNVPSVAWNFFIGGYQPAQKWLKDRKGRTLMVEDILHYQQIIVALNETARIMGEIDKIAIE
jgi:predicted helicase